VWDGWQQATKKFVEEDLVAVRDGMLGEAKEQQASEVFLRTLGELISFDHVRLEGMPRGSRDVENKPVVGRVVLRGLVPGDLVNGLANVERFEICTSLAMAQVNPCLRQQGRPELKITERALLQQLREDGKLLDANGAALAPDADPTRRVRLGGPRQVRAFAVGRRALLGDG
jgi:hypothetical protein